MAVQLKKWCLIGFLALQCIGENATLARPVLKQHKAPISKRHTARTFKPSTNKVILPQISYEELRRWQNDPPIYDIDRAMRKFLGRDVYSAVSCGGISTLAGIASNPTEIQKTLKRAIELHQKKTSFFYSIENEEFSEGAEQPPTYISDYRIIAGTWRGEIYEFWYEWFPSGKVTTNHRKWTKPTVQKKGNDILFFDAAQKANR